MALSAVSTQAISSASTHEAFFSELRASFDIIRSELDAVATDANSTARDRLIERLATLAAEAARFDQPVLSDELTSCHRVLLEVRAAGSMDAAVITQLDSSVQRMGVYVQDQLARGVAAGPEPERQSQVPRGPRRSPHGSIKVAVVGALALSESLRAEDWNKDDQSPALHIEAIGPSSMAHHDIASRKPDAVIIDADHDGARRLVERLMNSSDTDLIPILVVGTWEKAEDASPFIALGVARTTPKPASPSELRRHCLEVAPGQASAFEALGPLSIDDLGTRLTEELHRGLCDAANYRSRQDPIDLGSGDEVLTVMWEAIARIRELVTAKSKGAIRFAPIGPIEALPKANWLRGSSRRRHGERASKLHEVRDPGWAHSLRGCSVVVAEDDPSTNWFLTGVLNEAGAVVHSVYDGHEALDRVYRELPDLLLTDVVMPKLDGFTLCRAIKRDVLLRSVPVVLLSWKQDLLQRMRELGAGADGYMLKEASGNDVLHRVLEVLRPRRAVAERIAAGGTVRGRLDGLTAHALLRLVCDLRGDARVSLRDAHYLYEIELRGGRPVLATRTTASGVSERGASVIGALVGIGDGRFGISDIQEGEPYIAELDGTLDEQLIAPIARARAAQSLVSGSRLMRVQRVDIDDSRMMVQMLATPEPSRGLLCALVAGASPRELVASGRASSELLERVLGDAARHGAVREVLGARGTDLLPEAIDRELAVLSGEADAAVVVASRVALTGAIEGSQPLAEMHDDPPCDTTGPLEDTEESSAPLKRVAPRAEEDFAEVNFDEERDSPYEPGDVYDRILDDDLAPLVTGYPDDDLAAGGPFGRASAARAEASVGGHTPVLASAMGVSEQPRQHTPALSPMVRDGDPSFARLDDEAPEAQIIEAHVVEPSRPLPPRPPPKRRAVPAPTNVAAPTGQDAVFTADGSLVYSDHGPRVPRLPMPSAHAGIASTAPRRRQPRSSSSSLLLRRCPCRS